MYVANDILRYIKGLVNRKNIRILFMPYCFDMWDSMESVYLEAKDDIECEAFLMPIPYFTKEDGQVCEIHDESSRFPYPCENWSRFDGFYDVIVIHNPYDDHNRVTSVLPQFYSKALKNHCSKLVYIPYFVLNPGARVDEFALTNGVFFSDAVIVQDADVRNRYIKTLKASLGQMFYPFDFENRIVALGSPKLDIKKAVQRPHEWENKKIVLICLSVTSYLNNAEARLRRLDEIVDKFTAEENTIVVLRPHPLMEATFTSLNPSLLGMYHEIVNNCIRLGGLIDENDLHTSLAMADVLITNPSSVQVLWDASKPMSIF